MLVSFVKLQGAGNDFILIDDIDKPPGLQTALTPSVVRMLADRRLGIGADQLMWLHSPVDPSHDIKLDMFNADGSVAEMCGNGVRAVTRYLTTHPTKGRRSAYRIETLDGVKAVEVRGDLFRVDMGVPKLQGGFDQKPRGEKLAFASPVPVHFFEVEVGVPHAVAFVPAVTEYPLAEVGPLVEAHPRFPKRTNFDIVEMVDPHHFKLRVWERGAGLTLACGTGACASAAAAIHLGLAQSPVKAHLPGGTLTLEWAGAGYPMYMEGPAEEVFRGEMTI